MKWFIPGNVPSSKNGRRWTGKYFIASKTVMKYRKDTQSYYKKYAKEFSKELKKHTLPVKVSFTFIRGTRHKFDYIKRIALYMYMVGACCPTFTRLFII